MGMYDEIEVFVDLPGLPDGHDRQFQTKSLVRGLDNYRIFSDGTLWHERYDVEDRSDPSASGIARIAGMMTRVNKRWEQDVDYTGEIEVHDWDADRKVGIRYSMYFVKGQLTSGPHRLRD